jgi:hypothetical protein
MLILSSFAPQIIFQQPPATHSREPHKHKSNLTLHPLSLADLSRETGFDSRDGATRLAGVAGDEVQSVFALAELGVAGSTGFAGYVFDWKAGMLVDIQDRWD